MKKLLPLQFGAVPVLLLLSAAVSLTRCKKDHHPLNWPAEGSLQDAKGNCLPYTAHGTFIKGAPSGGDSNYVAISVDVSRIGTYTISTDSRNGVSFSDSGVFTRTGMNSVRLKPRGTFTSASSTTYPIVYGNTYCEFTVNVIDTSLPQGKFRFTGGDQFYTGFADWFLNFPPEGHPEQGYLVEINAGTTADTFMHFRIPMPYQFPSPTYGITYGTYSTANPGTSFVMVAGTDTIYYANPTTTGKAVNIYADTVYTASSGVQIVFQGRFSGTATNKTGATIPINNGVFKALY
jgi:hypothetical protein